MRPGPLWSEGICGRRSTSFQGGPRVGKLFHTGRGRSERGLVADPSAVKFPREEKSFRGPRRTTGGPLRNDRRTGTRAFAPDDPPDRHAGGAPVVTSATTGASATPGGAGARGEAGADPPTPPAQGGGEESGSGSLTALGLRLLLPFRPRSRVQTPKSHRGLYGSRSLGVEL